VLYLRLQELNIDIKPFEEIRGVFYSPNRNLECFEKIKTVLTEQNCLDAWLMKY
jgi:hypothetical protein